MPLLLPYSTGHTDPRCMGGKYPRMEETDYLPLSVIPGHPPFLLKLVCVFDLQQKEPRIRWNSESNALHFYP